jgi:competence protein ComEC
MARLRGGLQERLRRRLGDRSGLAEALVLAERGGIPRESRDAFAGAGVAHLLAISGFHVGVLAGLILALTGWAGAGPRFRTRAVSCALAGYVVFLGLPAAAVRATLLIALLAFARGLGREPHRVALLSTAFLLMLAIQPRLLGEVGFQLSFAGALGLAVVTRPASAPHPTPRWFPRRLRGTRVGRWLHDGILAGVAATLATLPMAVWHFGRLPLLGSPATLALSPLAALAVPLVLATLAADLVLPPLAAVAALPTGLVLGGFDAMVRAVAGIPGAWFWAPRGLGILVATALVLGTVLPRVLSAPGPGARWTARTALLISLLGIWPVVGTLRGAGVLEIVMLDVGQGDAIPIRTPAGRWILVDTGPARDGWDAGSALILPYLAGRGVRELEAVVLTHPDLDHLGGLSSVLAGIDVGRVLGGGTAAGKEALIKALETARREEVPWVRAQAGEVVSLDGMELSILHPGPVPLGTGSLGTGSTGTGPSPPEDANDRSVAMLVRFGEFTALLTGDAPSEVEERLVASGDLPAGGITVLKLGHHGSRTSTSSLLLDATHPRLALVSAGRGNRFGHPHPGVLGRLRARGIPWWNTARDGGIRIVARPDGEFESLPVR